MEQQSVLNDLAIDSVGAEQLRSFAGWAKFLSIIGFIMCGFIALAGIFAGSIFATLSPGSQYGGSPFAGMGVIMTVVYLILAVVYFIPTLYLFQSASRLKSALYSSDQLLLNDAFAKLKASFKFVGILTIVILSFYALVMVFAVLATAMR